jgi:YVTN family beta-propeller protein
MKTGSTIGMNGFAQALKKIFSDKKNSDQDNYVLKTYEDTEDHFFTEANDKLRKALDLDEPSESYERDLKRFGTRIKLIDVGDDAISNRRRKEILPLKGLNKSARDRYTNTYEDDLLRYGTNQGIINVSNDECKKKGSLSVPDNFSKATYALMMDKWKKKPVTPFSVNPFSDIFRDFPKLQITVNNKSIAEQEVTLWGGNQHLNVSGSSSSSSQDAITLSGQVSIPSQFYPQGIVVNPANELIYIVNQLSGTVTVLNSSNLIVQTIQLFPTFPGFCSPITLAVNTKVTSITYGFIYIVCSVSNTVVVIDLSFNILATIPVGTRPVGIAFNPTNLRMYVTNLVDNTMTIIDAELLIEIPINSPIPTGPNPIGVGIQLVNGDIYCTNSADDTISLYNNTDEPITTISGFLQYPVSATFNPINNFMYIVAMESNLVYLIETVTYTIVTTIPTGVKPYNSFYNSFNTYLYVQNTVDNTFTIIKPDNTLVPNTSVAELNIGRTYNVFNNSIYVSDTLNNTINILGMNVINLTVNDDYFEMRENFQSNVGIIQHTKFVVTGPERINSFRHNRFTPTGLIKSKAISFEQFASPQSKLNVAEVTALAGTIIDGKMNWKFKLPGLHTVTILIWYRYFEVRDLLTNNFNTNTHNHEKHINVPDPSLHCNS